MSKVRTCPYGHPMIYQGIDDCGDYDDCVCDWWFCEICGLAYEENPVCEDDSHSDPGRPCPDCGCELDPEVMDDLLYNISGGYDSREIMLRCHQCGYRETVHE